MAQFLNGMFVLHRCDNRRCCEPDHLFLGSQQDNVTDMIMKGRQCPGRFPGVLNPKAKLTEGLVAEIRRRYAAGVANQYVLAAEYGVRQCTISAIVRGATWKMA